MTGRSPWFAVCLVALAACTPSPSPPSPTPTPAAAPEAERPTPQEPAPPAVATPADDPSALARWDGYGDLRLGMSAAQARAAWGGELKGAPDEPGGCYYLGPGGTARTRDPGLMIEGDRFVRYDIHGERVVAPGGGHTGMSDTAIERLYKGRVESQPHHYVEGGRYLRIPAGEGAGVLLFETDASGRVTSWRVGLPPQVDYVEGCS